MRRAVDVIAESAKPIPMAQAEARERIWTPDNEAEEEDPSATKDEAGKLWTPGS
jgi:hypothetical protein